MKVVSRLLCFVLSLLVVFSVAGCESTKDAYIYFELPSTPDVLDPQTASADSELLIVKNIFEGLLRKNSEGKIVCGVAEIYETDGINYTFTLRKNAKWSNGEKLTAKDFEFALKRAVSPETKAPFASRLFSIKGAEEIYNGSANKNTLSVKAVDNQTLKITLKEKDEYFEETLTTSVAMPCNEKFFKESAGKYGLSAAQTLSNGSYKLTKWRRDPFGIRLYKNNEYKGDLESQNAAVFLTCNDDEPIMTKLEKNSIDMAFIDCSLTEDAEKLGLKTEGIQNICWFLTLSDDFSPNMRKALNMLVGGEVYSKDLKVGYSTATSIFPEVIKGNKTATGITVYNQAQAKQLYMSEVELLENKKFPSDVVLYYYDNGSMKSVVTDIVGHWQSSLSAFVNIESVSNADLLKNELVSREYKMAIFPIRADSQRDYEYLEKFGINSSGDLTAAQTELLKSNNIIPIMFQNTVIAYSPALTKVSAINGDGYIDFSFIVKTE